MGALLVRIFPYRKFALNFDKGAISEFFISHYRFVNVDKFTKGTVRIRVGDLFLPVSFCRASPDDAD